MPILCISIYFIITCKSADFFQSLKKLKHLWVGEMKQSWKNNHK